MGCFALSPCLVQISWETQAEWLRTMQEDARIYKAISIVQSPQRLIYYRAYLSGSANSHHPFFIQHEALDCSARTPGLLYNGFVTEVFYVLFYNQVALWMIFSPPLIYIQ